jgi:putative ABC transport system substrate-binding protein
MNRRTIMTLLGSAAAWPIAALAQQPAMPVIGFLSSGSPEPWRAAFRKGLSDQGYVEGRNVEILYLSDKSYDRLPALAADLVRRQVSVIVAAPPIASAVAAKAATSKIPIVFATGFDPVEFGLVESLNRPGGNVTGVTFLIQTLIGKRLELLHEMAPAAKVIGFLVNPTTPTFDTQIKEAEIAARVLEVQLVIQKATTPSEIDTAFSILLEQRIGAFLAGADTLFAVQGRQLSALADRNAIPAIYTIRDVVDAGGLMSYGASLDDAFRLVGTYAGRILKGGKPSDLPVQQSTKVELILNLKTAKALGLTVPLSLRARADEVIE